MMPVNRFIVSTSGYGRFGMGLHFAQLVEESRSAGELYGYLATSIRRGDDDISMLLKPPAIRRALRYIPWPVSQSSHYEIVSRHFERLIAEKLPRGPRILMTFAGRSDLPIQRARQLGYHEIELVSANSHIANVVRQHGAAAEQFGIKDSWVNSATATKMMNEYRGTDRIFVHSEYVRESFLEEGFDEDKLVRTHLVPNPRFVPPKTRPSDDVFRVVYVGRVDSSKGIPLLISAFQQMRKKNARLTLVGGWTTRSMKRYLTRITSKDNRISVRPGDPLPILHKADVLVHPSFEDGFAYAPLEALCCGVPVIVTGNTGMKEHVTEGENGYVVPSGQLDPIVDYLNVLADNPLLFDAKKLRNRFYK